ncbi:MAG: GLUG motif-containing protein, partial [Sedimentisphaerales bacterium]
MTKAENSKIIRTITVLITICSLSFPAYAKYSGGNGEPNDPYQLATAEDLLLLGDSPEDYDKHFILTADIDLDPNLPGRKVFDKAVIAPDVNETNEYFDGTPFTGTFDGNGHVISHVTVEGIGYLGLFGRLGSSPRDAPAGGKPTTTRDERPGAEVRNLGVLNASITGSSGYVGGLAGWVGDVAIFGCYSTGTVSGNGSIGGLVGHNGVAIWSERRSFDPVIRVGGRIANCYSTCSVTGTATVGGLVGYNDAGSITTCYSAGRVSGNDPVGGLVGSPGYGTTSECFWDTQTSGQATSAGGTGKTTAEMQTATTFMCWASEGVWTIDEGRGYPRLSWENGPGQPIVRAYCYGGGSGTEGDPYLIWTAEQL